MHRLAQHIYIYIYNKIIKSDNFLNFHCDGTCMLYKRYEFLIEIGKKFGKAFNVYSKYLIRYLLHSQNMSSR